MLERFLFYVRHSFNDLKVNRQRTLFALLCIGAGVAAIVSLQTLAVMMNNTLTGSLQESNRGDIRISPSFAFEEDEDDERGSGQGQPDTGTDIDRGIEEGILVESDGAFEGVTQISPQGLEALETWFAENTDGATLTYRQQPISFDSATSIAIPERDTDAIFIQNYFIESDLYPLYGEIESEEDESLDELLNEPTDIVISRNLADDLGAEVGDRVRVSGASEDFVLRGIIPTREESGFQNFLGNLTGYFFLDVRSVALFDDMEPQVATEVYVQLENPDEVDEVATALVEDYPYLNTTTTTDLEETNEQISSTVDDLVVIMGLVSLLIGGIGIVNTMLVIVSRRTTEIAVLKTIGL
ncbi:MAG: ABC transporter permease, partial [Chloroflexi bacterium]|nr:ABC transporter permease [Chloroflexota bacterium]